LSVCRASFFLTAALLAVLSACTSQPLPDRADFDPVGFDALPGWRGDSHYDALAALLKSCVPFTTPSQRTVVGTGPAARPMEAWRAACEAAERVPAGNDNAARRFFENRFQAFRVSNRGDADGLFTGYYEPELRGSLSRSAEYSVPLYRRPPELVTVQLGDFRDEWRGRRIAGAVKDGRLKPFAARKEIETGSLAGRGLELVWVDDPVAAFFLHIQGSGRVRLDDGRVLRIGYDGTNGYDYTSVGRILIDNNTIDRASLDADSIQNWMRANPDKARDLMRRNESFVFFRELDTPTPIGSQGVPLTPERSLAVDRRYIPLGVPVWLSTTDPLSREPLRRLMVAQDTGGAIKGVVRGDFFWGHGTRAARSAARMKNAGRYYVLLPRGSAGPGV
jgi:membrane-bound lytic murein transglycosylase A